jgi:hypothetical protein
VIVGFEAEQKIPQHPALVSVYNFLDGSGWRANRNHLGVIAENTVVLPDKAALDVEADIRFSLFMSLNLSMSKLMNWVFMIGKWRNILVAYFHIFPP